WLLMRIQWSWNADCDKVNIFYKAEIGGSRKHTALYNFSKVAVYNVTDVVMTCVDHIYLLWLYIKADCFEASFCLLNSQRQTNIAQSNNSDNDFLIFYLAEQFIFHHG